MLNSKLLYAATAGMMLNDPIQRSDYVPPKVACERRTKLGKARRKQAKKSRQKNR